MPRRLPPPSPSRATRELVSVVVVELAEILRAGHRDAALRIGRLVYEQVLGADGDALRSAPSHPSYAALAADPRLPMSASTLWRAVAIYELVTRLPAAADSRHLGVAHLRAVLGLSHEQQSTLLRDADTQRWTKERLEREAGLLRARRVDGRGRPPVPAIVRTVDAASRVVARASMPELTRSASSLGPETARRLAAAASELREFARVVEELIQPTLRPEAKAG